MSKKVIEAHNVNYKYPDGYRAIKNVSFDDLTLFDFEVGAVGSCECPFSFTDMECIDLI